MNNNTNSPDAQAQLDPINQANIAMMDAFSNEPGKADTTSPTKPFKENIRILSQVAFEKHGERRLDYISDRLAAFPKYVNSIWECEMGTQMARIRFSDSFDPKDAT